MGEVLARRRVLYGASDGPFRTSQGSFAWYLDVFGA